MALGLPQRWVDIKGACELGEWPNLSLDVGDQSALPSAQLGLHNPITPLLSLTPTSETARSMLMTVARCSK